MNIDKKIMLVEFGKNNFSEKKEILLNMLGKLTGTTDVIDELGKMVYRLSEDNESGLYLDVYEILIDALISVENNNIQELVDNLGKVQDLLLKAKKEEEEDRLTETKDLDNMFNDL